MDRRTRGELIAENTLLKERLGALEAEVEMLRDKLSGGGKGSSAAPFIKPNRQQRREAERAERKKRTQSFVRKRDVPTEEVRHALDNCPDCGRKLSGGWEHARRQVIEIPDTPVRIIEECLDCPHMWSLWQGSHSQAHDIGRCDRQATDGCAADEPGFDALSCQANASKTDSEALERSF